jgi:hypothetical protein
MAVSAKVVAASDGYDEDSVSAVPSSSWRPTVRLGAAHR